MQYHRIIMIGALALGVGAIGAPAFSQDAATTMNDVAYCNQLSGIYNRFLGDSTPSMSTISAETDCNNGHVAEAIPQLEKLLLSKGYKLPDKAIGHQQ